MPDKKRPAKRKGPSMEEELRAAQSFQRKHMKGTSSGLTALQKAGKLSVGQKIARYIFRD